MFFFTCNLNKSTFPLDFYIRHWTRQNTYWLPPIRSCSLNQPSTCKSVFSMSADGVNFGFYPLIWFISIKYLTNQNMSILLNALFVVGLLQLASECYEKTARISTNCDGLKQGKWGLFVEFILQWKDCKFICITRNEIVRNM